MGTEYATLDDIDEIEPDLHVRGTIPRPGGKLEFWLAAPRPKGVDVEEWDRIQQAKWDHIFGKKEAK
mgnify:FL=1